MVLPFGDGLLQEPAARIIQNYNNQRFENAIEIQRDAKLGIFQLKRFSSISITFLQ